MGLLNRAARGARRALQDTGLPHVPAFNALVGGGVGAGLDAKYGDDGIGDGAVGGALVGAGLGLAGGARRMLGNVGGMISEAGAAKLAAKKEQLIAQVLRVADPSDAPRAQQAAQMIRNARDEIDLKDVVGRIQSPQFWYGGGPVQKGASYGMRPPQDEWGR